MRYLTKNKPQFNGDNSRQLITLQQMRQLINIDMPIQHKAVLMVLAKTGIRRGELLGINLEDINLDKKEIVLKPVAKRTNRLVFYDNETANVLNVFLEWRKTRAKASSLFISVRGRSMDKEEPNHIIAEYGRLLGLHDPAGTLNKKLTPHCFRHFFTTLPQFKPSIPLFVKLKLAKHTPTRANKPFISPYGEITQCVLSLLKEKSGMTPIQINKDLKKKYNTISDNLVRNMKRGYVSKDVMDFFVREHPDLVAQYFNEASEPLPF